MNIKYLIILFLMSSSIMSACSRIARFTEATGMEIAKTKLITDGHNWEDYEKEALSEENYLKRTGAIMAL